MPGVEGAENGEVGDPPDTEGRSANNGAGTGRVEAGIDSVPIDVVCVLPLGNNLDAAWEDANDWSVLDGVAYVDVGVMDGPIDMDRSWPSRRTSSWSAAPSDESESTVLSPWSGADTEPKTSAAKRVLYGVGAEEGKNDVDDVVEMNDSRMLSSGERGWSGGRRCGGEDDGEGECILLFLSPYRLLLLD